MDRRQRELLDAVELAMNKFLEAKRKNDHYRTELRFKIERTTLRQLKLAIDNACDLGYMNLENCSISLEKIMLKFSDKHTSEKFTLEVA